MYSVLQRQTELHVSRKIVTDSATTLTVARGQIFYKFNE